MLRSVIKSTAAAAAAAATTTIIIIIIITVGVEKARNRLQNQRNDDFDDNLEHICNREQHAM